MDDFFTSMQDVIQSQDIRPDKQTDSSSNSMYAEALVPLNPYRWPAFAVGSAAASDLPDLEGKLGTPFSNLQVAQEYLAWIICCRCCVE